MIACDTFTLHYDKRKCRSHFLLFYSKNTSPVKLIMKLQPAINQAHTDFITSLYAVFPYFLLSCKQLERKQLSHVVKWLIFHKVLRGGRNTSSIVTVSYTCLSLSIFEYVHVFGLVCLIYKIMLSWQRRGKGMNTIGLE